MAVLFRPGERRATVVHEAWVDTGPGPAAATLLLAWITSFADGQG